MNTEFNSRLESADVIASVSTPENARVMAAEGVGAFLCADTKKGGESVPNVSFPSNVNIGNIYEKHQALSTRLSTLVIKSNVKTQKNKKREFFTQFAHI